jgi:hypothetical protein
MLCVRAAQAMGTMLGQYLDDHWQLHRLSGIATDLVINTIKKAKANGKGFILDGSPRTPREAEMVRTVAFTCSCSCSSCLTRPNCVRSWRWRSRPTGSGWTAS